MNTWANIAQIGGSITAARMKLPTSYSQLEYLTATRKTTGSCTLTDHRQTILLLGGDLEEGESTPYGECPECKKPGTKSFNVTRTQGGLLYNCFRDSCDLRGYIGARSAIPSKRKKRKVKDSKPYTRTLRPMSGPERARFLIKHGLDYETLVLGRFKYAPEDDAYAFPVMDPRGYERGLVIRYYDGRENKAIAYPDIPDAPWQSWYINNSVEPFKVVALVEDQVSALKLSQWITTVAILGTSMSEAQALEVTNVKPDRVIIALDEDAANSADKLRKWYGLLWGDVEIVYLTLDVKDMQDAEIIEVFGCTKTR